MKRGSLIIYDDRGKVLINTGDAEGDVLPNYFPTNLYCIETQFGELNGKRVISVDVETKTLITEDIIIPLSDLEIQLLNAQEQLINLEFEKLIGGV